LKPNSARSSGRREEAVKEQAIAMTRLSCHRFRANEVRLWLSVLAYNLGNLWRRLALPTQVATWSLTSLQQRLAKTGGRLIKHARYYWLLLAESHLTRRLFGNMLQKIAALPRQRDKARRRAEQFLMTTPGTQGEVSPESMGKGHLQPLGAPQTLLGTPPA
jgi:hypothetical protein